MVPGPGGGEHAWRSGGLRTGAFGARLVHDGEALYVQWLRRPCASPKWTGGDVVKALARFAAGWAPGGSSCRTRATWSARLNPPLWVPRRAFCRAGPFAAPRALDTVLNDYNVLRGLHTLLGNSPFLGSFMQVPSVGMTRLQVPIGGGHAPKPTTADLSPFYGDTCSHAEATGYKPFVMFRCVGDGKTLIRILRDPSAAWAPVLPELLATFIRSVMHVAVLTGFRHGDMHLGNVLVHEPPAPARPRLVLIDFGRSTVGGRRDGSYGSLDVWSSRQNPLRGGERDGIPRSGAGHRRDVPDDRAEL